jgi:hypothetical protein
MVVRRPFRMLVLLSAILLPVMLGGCVPVPGVGTSPLPAEITAAAPAPEAATAAAAPSPSATAAAPAPVVATAGLPPAETPAATGAPGPTPTVTLDDNGGTIRLRPGQRFLLMLGEGYNWTVTVADPNIASRVIGVLVVRGAQGLYEAHTAGETALNATGDPVCRSARPPCAMPTRLFGVTIAVASD